jgi:hypothetical protein
MSKYLEFCNSLRFGRATAREDQLGRADEEHVLAQAVAQVVRRMCAYFQCPEERVRYLDARSGMATGAVRGGTPLLPFNPEKGRYCLDLQLGLAGRPEEEPYPVWVHLECAPLKHGGLEFHLGSAIFQLPREEHALFDELAVTINRKLREDYVPGPRRIGW